MIGISVRASAVEVVHRVLRSGAFSNVLVPREVAKLEEQDRGLAQFLAFGTLRQLPRIDRIIAGYSQRPRLESFVEDCLRVAVHELTFGDAPSHAIVDSFVEVVKQAGYERAAGYVNGVLRSAARHGEPQIPEGITGRALLHGVTEWLVSELDNSYGVGASDAFLTASQEAPLIGLRRRAGVEVHPDIRPVNGIEESYYGTFVPEGYVVQDAASVAVGLSAEIQSGERVLDMAAAPGGKSLHLFDLAGAENLVLADRHAKRVVRSERRTRKAGCSAPWVIADGREPPFARASFDVVVLDAPCTGLGTLRRRPEIRLKVSRAEIERLSALQAQLVEAARGLLKPSGRLVYSVCTVTSAETEQIAKRFEGVPPPILQDAALEHGVLLSPDRTGTDGMYISVIRP